MRAIAIAGAVLLAVATPANSSWQYTKWGMSLDAVKSAGAGSVIEYSDANLDTSQDRLEAIANYDALGHSFVAMFYFNLRTHGLSKVSLMLKKPATCSDLEPDVRRVYGQPNSVLPLGVRQWRDEPNSNIVTLVPLSGCFLEYMEIPQRSGL